jgi:hypothetical protein
MKTENRALAARLILIAVGASFPALAQDRESRSLTGFDAIEVGGGIDLVLRQGDGFLVEVEAADPTDIITEVRGRTLSVRRPSSLRFFHWGDAGSVTVRLPTLVALTASGGSDARAEGTITGERLELAASGGSDLTIDVAVTTLEVEASGGSDVRLSGNASAARVTSSGGSDLNASGLTTTEARLESSGGSDLSIAVRERLVANASGGSDITYSGDPHSVDVNTSGGSDVRRR